MAQDLLWLDTETYSPVSLKTAGVYPYSEHPDAEVMVVTYALGDGPVQTWDAVQEHDIPGDLWDMLCDKDLPIAAHNAQFDRVMCNAALFPQFGGLNVALERWRCTMVRAWSCGLPGALGDLSRVVGIDEGLQKTDGRFYINLFCIPDKKTGKRTMPWDEPAEWAKFLKYAGQDIVSMRACMKRVPLGCWMPSELAIWHLDQRINDRGWLLDRKLADGAIEETSRQAKVLKQEVTDATDGAVTAVTQRDKLLAHILEAFGVPLPDLKKATLEKRLEDPDLPDEVKELIRMRLSGSKASVSKYKAALAGISRDGRMRGTLQYGGASRTLRWSGRRFQPQNLPRPTMKKPDIAKGIDLLREGKAWLDYDVMELAQNAVRGLIIPSPGKKLVVADLANIEGRIQAWVAGEEWKLLAFRQFDRGEGPDLYKVSYGRAFDIDPALIADDSWERQIGKVIELACGYQGAVGAFQAMAAVYRVTVEDERALALVKAWRKAHPKTVNYWYALSDAVFRAQTGKTVELGPITIGWKGEWLFLRLPSGRKLYFPKPQITDDEKITFGSVNRYSKKWEQQSTYGGKLFENIVQALSRDVLALGMLRAEQEGYDVILTVHDEIIAEAPDRPEFNAKALGALMTEGADWTKGLPLAAAGFEAYRYRK